MKTVPLLFWCAVVYGVLLLAVRGTLSSESIPAIPLTGIPLIVIAVIIVRDLARRSTSPSLTAAPIPYEAPRENPVEFLSGQMRVAARASDSYFDNVVRSKLKELLVTKIVLETGLEPDAIRRRLSDPKQGPRLLRDEELYSILYGPVPQTESDKMSVIEDAIDMIGAWKG